VVRQSHIFKTLPLHNQQCSKNLAKMKTMLKNLTESTKEKARVFQVLLLNNDASQEVEVQEAEHIDFLRVQKHLKHGGSVFITSKRSQKLTLPKKKKSRNKKGARRVTAFYFNRV
jgi:membrane glycosyltransferase